MFQGWWKDTNKILLSFHYLTKINEILVDAHVIRGPRATFTDQGPFSTAAFFPNYKKNMLSVKLPIYSYYNEHENYLKGKFQLMGPNSSEIFKIIILPRVPGATCCIWSSLQEATNDGLLNRVVNPAFDKYHFVLKQLFSDVKLPNINTRSSHCSLRVLMLGSLKSENNCLRMKWYLSNAGFTTNRFNVGIRTI